ncbi:DUF4365 domain-containing protein [Arthrobacter sp. JUb115]|uniref:DUF4365 domain-containing protein n=1 Tax=Arthrobacter sp. JUb115 TaxID=2485108 RepID=UPI00105CBB66|nr:DUF4365 domain-containing protein [Arthrobacter sp. JUb115]
MSELFPAGPTFSNNTRKGRYGVAYFQNVCAQFGVGFDPTSPDEDVLAIDGTVQFAELPVRIQIKCTKKRFNSNHQLTWPIDNQWKRKWEQNFGPAYFVVVQVPNDTPERWIGYEGKESTLLHATAYWTRIETANIGSSIAVNRSSRLTSKTLALWNQDLVNSFSTGGAQ